MRTLLIDNYDSFTFNLFQLISQVNGVEPTVVKNDEVSWADLSLSEFDNIVISPGPGRPDEESDFGICSMVIQQANIPIFGVCLGHQGICQIFGGEIDYAETVMHGRPSNIYHTGEAIFADIPSPFSVIRYHSLYVTKLPENMRRLAWTSDGMIMAAESMERPIWSVQFHPESINTEFGSQMFTNFNKFTQEFIKQRQDDLLADNKVKKEYVADLQKSVVLTGQNKSAPQIHGKAFEVHFRKLSLDICSELAFLGLYQADSTVFWLDSAILQDGARYSYMGSLKGPHAEYVTYDLNKKKVAVQWQDSVQTYTESIFDYLDRMIKKRSIHTDALPFDFNLGYVGYLGYELKGDCGATSEHQAYTPDAALVFADRMVVFDHLSNEVYILCLDDVENTARAQAWLDETVEALKKIAEVQYPLTEAKLENGVAAPIKQSFRHDAESYLKLIETSQMLIKKGQSYEVCLTNMIKQHVDIEPLNTFCYLRKMNSAPYAAYLNFPQVSIMSSSPELFLEIDRQGGVESRPIKGTRKRGATKEEDELLFQDLSENEKDRSENLMIVDLLRNDLGQVCEVGSVHVSEIFAVKSYATVHQLVSTVRGSLKESLTSIDCVRACFPGGSMTGAPKIRTMEIIDRLEGSARGVYSGSIGFLGLNGTGCLNIAIRTIVKTDIDVTVGVGGAIIDLSDPHDELDEMILKSKALTVAAREHNPFDLIISDILGSH